MTFRKARRSDYLDSYLREHVLSTLPDREVAFELLTGQFEDRFILTDAHNPLGKLQDAQGHHHWSRKSLSIRIVPVTDSVVSSDAAGST